MKTIHIDNSIIAYNAESIEEKGITLTCNAEMNIEISDDDFEKLCEIINPLDIHEV